MDKHPYVPYIPSHSPHEPPLALPWELPPLDDWYIVSLNHQVRYEGSVKKVGIFCCMTKGTRCIEAHGPDAHSVFLSLSRKAHQLMEAGLA